MSLFELIGIIAFVRWSIKFLAPKPIKVPAKR
jgi:hypothetical protein